MIAKKERNTEEKVLRYTFYLKEEEAVFSDTAKANKEILDRLFEASEDPTPESDPFKSLRGRKVEKKTSK